MWPEKIEALCYGLILLQEIAQGYDNNWYRQRAETILLSSGYVELATPMMRWLSHSLSTPCFIDIVEDLIENVTRKPDS